jgi:hypothetical protein
MLTQPHFAALYTLSKKQYQNYQDKQKKDAGFAQANPGQVLPSQEFLAKRVRNEHKPHILGDSTLGEQPAYQVIPAPDNTGEAVCVTGRDYHNYVRGYLGPVLSKLGEKALAPFSQDSRKPELAAGQAYLAALSMKPSQSFIPLGRS